MKTNKIIIEIRASEGGQDSKLLVKDLSEIYIKSCKNKGFKIDSIDNRPGMSIL
jgi:protein subunit release factor A